MGCPKEKSRVHISHQGRDGSNVVYKPITAGFTQCFTQKNPNQATIKLSAMCVLVQRERMAVSVKKKEGKMDVPAKLGL